MACATGQGLDPLAKHELFPDPAGGEENSPDAREASEQEIPNHKTLYRKFFLFECRV